jgi:glycosyltransferase involved in cell wall biosynthesis
MTRASVCIATYNGEKFLSEQLDSILHQIGPLDEIIVVDDGSNDRTLDILRGYTDRRIRLYLNEKNMGFYRTFEKAINLAEGRHIVLSDQDDIWIDGRLEKMCAALDCNPGLISSNFCFINSVGEPIIVSALRSLKADESLNCTSNITRLFFGKMQYFGSAMAFSAQLREILLPFPQYLETHDHWIAIAANLSGMNRHIEDITLKRRIHGNNVSLAGRKHSAKLYSRFVFIMQTFELLRRIYFTRRLAGKTHPSS